MHIYFINISPYSILMYHLNWIIAIACFLMPGSPTLTAPTPVRWVSYDSGINVQWDNLADVVSYTLVYSDSAGNTYTISPISTNTAKIPCNSRDGSTRHISYKYITSNDSSYYSPSVTLICATSKPINSPLCSSHSYTALF